QLFAQSLGGTPQNAEALRRLAEHLKGMPSPGGTKNTKSPPPPPPEPFPNPLPLDVPIDTFVGDWLRAGSIVGRGRRGLDVLVIRTPGEQLSHLGLIHPKATKRIAAA